MKIFAFSLTLAMCTAFHPTLVRRSVPRRLAAERADMSQSSVRDRYKQDLLAIEELFDQKEEEKLERIKQLIKQIQQLRAENPEVALSPKLREALVDAHKKEDMYGKDSREAKMSWTYVEDISVADNLKHGLDEEFKNLAALENAVHAVDALEDLKEIAHVEKKILDRYGTTDFEIGEGFLERPIGREDDDTALWP